MFRDRRSAVTPSPALTSVKTRRNRSRPEPEDSVCGVAIVGSSREKRREHLTVHLLALSSHVSSCVAGQQPTWSKCAQNPTGVGQRRRGSYFDAFRGIHYCW